MNREIKFRAWDGKSFSKYVLNPHDLLALSNKLELQPQTILTQYTGLHDKNGIEIYEGDLLMKMGQFTTPKRNVYEVIFDEGAFIGHSIKDYEVVGKGKRHITLFPLTESWDNFPAEIIGNIYENKN